MVAKLTVTEEAYQITKQPGGLSVTDARCWQRQDAVIEAYCGLGTLAKAAIACNLTPEAAYYWQANNTNDFNVRLAKVGIPGYRDWLEALVHSRLADPTGNRGSDVLLMGALNANHPDKWSRNVSVTHEVGREVMSTLKAIQDQQRPKEPGAVIEHEPWKSLTPAQSEQLKEGKDDGGSSTG